MVTGNFALNDTDVSILLRTAIEGREVVLPAFIYSKHQMVKLSLTIFDIAPQK